MRQQNKAPIWEQAPMLRLLCSLIAGIVTYDTVSHQHLNAPLLISILLFIFLLYILLVLKSRWELLTTALGFLCVAVLGFLLCFSIDDRQRSNYFGHHINSAKTTLAVVSTEGIKKNKTIKYELNLINSIHNKEAEAVSGKALLYVFKNEHATNMRMGDTLLLPNNWQIIRNGGNPFEVDYQKFCARKGIYFQQFMSSEKAIIYGAKDSNTHSIIYKTHRYGINCINQYVKDSNTNALLKAMLLGDERDLDPNIRESYADTGIIHIVSISGAHVGILFAAIGLLFGLAKRHKNKWLQLSISLGLVWFYVIVAGASTPALRAAIMFSILAIGNASQQQSNPINQLLVAAFVLLLVNPMWLYSVGFQLSIIAVLSLIIFYAPILSILPQPNVKGKSKATRCINYSIGIIINALAASIAAEILVAPLVAYYFHSFPPLFLIANVVASLAMTAVLIMGMLLILFSQIGVVAQLLSILIVCISQIFHQFISWLQQFNNDALKTIQLSVIALILLYIFVATIAHFWLQKNKKSLWASLTAMLLFSIVHLYHSWKISQQNGIIMYNQSGNAQVEHYWGNNFCTINANDGESFAQKNAHIGLNLQHKIYTRPQAVFIINGQKIAVLRDEAILPNTFPVDILVVTTEAQKVDVKTLQKIFTPKKIVIANNQKPYQIKEWESQCASLEIALHYTKKDGAFVLP